MSRTFADLLPTPLAAESLASLAPLSRADDLLLLLTRWVERGWLRALDKAFVGFLHERAPDGDPLVLLAAAGARVMLPAVLRSTMAPLPPPVRRSLWLASVTSTLVVPCTRQSRSTMPCEGSSLIALPPCG